MTIANAVNKSGPYFYNGAATSFAYGFKIDDAAHIRAVETVLATGIETDLVLNSDYTVTGVGNDTGNVVISPARAAGRSVTLVRNVPFTQLTVLENQGAYFAEVVEAALDRAVARDQQLAEQISRAVVVPVSADATDLEDLIAGVVALLDSVDAVMTVASIAPQVVTVAANVTPVSVVANNITSVQTVAANMAAVLAVNGLAAQVAADAVQTAADRVATGQDRVATAADRVVTSADRVVTTADRAVTTADKAATAADRVQTGLDRAAAAASAASVAPLADQIHSASAKTTPVDADEIGAWDSVSTALRKVTWANIKATLLTFFAGIFPRYDAAQSLNAGQSSQFRSNVGAPALPILASGVGQMISITAGSGVALVLPSGGNWSYSAFNYNSSAGTLNAGIVSGVAAGGTTLAAGVGGQGWFGWAWRIN